MAQKRGHIVMPTLNQISKFMMSNRLNQNFSAAMPIYDECASEQDQNLAPNTMKFAKHMRLPMNTNNAFDQDEMTKLVSEMDQMLEEEFDEAAVPTYQMIQTYDRKNLKMKKHKKNVQTRRRMSVFMHGTKWMNSKIR